MKRSRWMMMMLVIALTVFCKTASAAENQESSLTEGKQTESSQTEDSQPISEKIKLGKSVQAKDVYEIKNPEEISYLKMEYQKAVTDMILSKWEKENPTIHRPILILNPYGTNNLSLNVYFKSSERAYLKYTIETKDPEIPSFTRIAASGNEGSLTKDHAYELLGLVPGVENKVRLALYNYADRLIGSYTTTITMPDVTTGIKTKLKTIEGESKQKLSDGLFCLFGHAENFSSNIYMYDNDGILRGDIPVSRYRSDRILFADNCILYSYASNRIAKVNRLGQVVDKFTIKGYTFHHDMQYDEVNNRIVALATEKDSETIEDVIISVDLKDGKVQKLLDFKDILPECYEVAVQPEKKKKLDWIHFNSIEIIDGKDLILSSRETSSIIRVNDVDKKPVLTYILSDQSMWENSVYSEYVYDKKGDFTAQAGQHAVTYMEDSSLKEGQYYVYMFNNNFGFSSTKPDFQWTNYKDVSNYKVTEPSKYYLYLVDENEKTFSLKKSFDVPTSLYVSSVQKTGNNILMCSSLSYEFGEYDTEGVAIRKYQFEDQYYTYRNFKYDFEDFYFTKNIEKGQVGALSGKGEERE